MTYDGRPHGTTGKAYGANGEDLGPVDITYNTLGGGPPVHAGTYTATGTFAGNQNYASTTGTAQIIIDKANASINVTPYHVTYDGNAHTATGTATGVGGAGLSAGLNLTGTTHTDAGDYPSDAWSFAGGTDYNDASGTVHDIIDKANASINVTPYHVTYDGNAHTATGTATGVGNAVLSAGLNLTGTTHTDAGDYPSDAWSFAGGTDYNDASGTVHDIIDKARPS